MPTVELTRESFATTVQDNGIVFVDFWAEWCGPCKRFAPIFDKAAEQHADVVFGKVDTEDQRALAGGLGIQAIPTLMAFRDGYLVFREAGALSGPQFERVIAAVKELDMETVKAQSAATD
ncbi:MAG: thioredoxin [Micropruina sp.]|nr:thioredoxin [Micropruina sp.]